MNIKKHIPNTITSMNLLCGCFAIVAAFNEQLTWSAMLIGLAAIFDFFDGLVARLLHVHSEIGKQLDSLADVISFGAVPGIIMFHFISADLGDYYTPINERSINHLLLSSVAFIIPVLSAVRLAKFNIDPRQSDSFIGVPTPANAILIGSLILIMDLQLNLNIYSPAALETNTLLKPFELTIASLLYNPYVLGAICIIMSLLLVAELPLFALKFKNLSWADNKTRFLFIIISVGLLITLKLIALPIIIVFYILLSIINNFASAKH